MIKTEQNPYFSPKILNGSKAKCPDYSVLPLLIKGARRSHLKRSSNYPRSSKNWLASKAFASDSPSVVSPLRFIDQITSSQSGQTHGSSWKQGAVTQKLGHKTYLSIVEVKWLARSSGGPLPLYSGENASQRKCHKPAVCLNTKLEQEAAA